MKLAFRYGRKAAAAVALAISLLMCYAAGQMNTGETALSPLSGGSAEARLSYITQLGWQVDDDEARETVLLPEEFDSAYDDYLAIQRECGFDLLPYRGQTVERYSRSVLNYPEDCGPVRLDLLVFEGQIIGGDVRSASLDGFMRSLAYPPQNAE